MKLIDMYAFADSSVCDLYLFCPVAEFTAGKNMLGGARADFRIRVGREVYPDYRADYSWGEISADVLVPSDKDLGDLVP